MKQLSDTLNDFVQEESNEALSHLVQKRWTHWRRIQPHAHEGRGSQWQTNRSRVSKTQQRVGQMAGVGLSRACSRVGGCQAFGSKIIPRVLTAAQKMGSGIPVEPQLRPGHICFWLTSNTRPCIRRPKPSDVSVVCPFLWRRAISRFR